MLTRLNLARLLVVLGFLVGLGSVAATFGHIGDPAFTARPDFDGGAAHPWYHALREAFGDIAAMAAILLVFFGPARLRNPGAWVVCLILMLGYYLPFWAGMPFIAELRAPAWGAELNHMGQALPALIGLFLARREFVWDN